MLSSAVRSYTDVEAYTKALPSKTIDMHVTQRGEFKARTTMIALHELKLRRYADNLARITYAALLPGRAVIAFRTEPGPDLFWGGQQMLPTSILLLNEGSCSFQRSAGSASWGAISLPVEMMGGALATLAARDLSLPRDAVTVVPPPEAMVRLQRLHASCGVLAEKAPDLLINPEAARGIEQALIGAMIECFDKLDDRDERLAPRLHASVMRRFHAVVEVNDNRALYTTEISAAIGVSGRTLRNCCREHLGMGASRYLMLRRMHLARRALDQSTPDTATVTEAATRFGFWELGRFSVGYKSLFGEMPSQTLRRQRGETVRR
jgi:AraC-like DNA-binding protein